MSDSTQDGVTQRGHYEPESASACESAYTAWTGLTLRCTGEHLRGNIMRGEVHQAPALGMRWTWYDEEADRKPQCDGWCHDEGTGDCERCESGDERMCDDCTAYAAEAAR